LSRSRELVISRTSLTAGFAGLVLVALLTGCGSGATDPADDGAVVTTSVAVRDNLTFDPSNIIVTPGATVTWTWEGGLVHNVTWVAASLPNSPDQTTGTFGATMPSVAGTLAYYCTFHGTPTSGMRGTVRVE
jgi:plastocyanin